MGQAKKEFVVTAYSNAYVEDRAVVNAVDAEEARRLAETIAWDWKVSLSQKPILMVEPVLNMMDEVEKRPASKKGKVTKRYVRPTYSLP